MTGEDGDSSSASAPDEGDAPPPLDERESGTASGASAAPAAPFLGALTGPRFGLGRRAWQAVVAITVVGLVARLVALGARTMHYDEARVAYWTLRYAETGHFEYRYIIHGPLIQHVDRWLFALVGPSDFAARLPVALVGGLLPATALLFRDHLRDEELVGLALFLMLNPILLYYSRFIRSDLLVATFAFAAFGCLVRLVATRRPRYLHAAAVLFALAFASKENAVVYLLVWVGAAALVVDTGLFRPRSHESGFARLRAARARASEAVRTSSGGPLRVGLRVGGHAALAAALVTVVTLVLFAPRGTGGDPGLWAVLGDPGALPAVVDTTLSDLDAGMQYWFGQSSDPGCFEETVIGGYVCYLERFLWTMWRYAAPLTALAAGGFLLERYGREPRWVVMFAGYWGVVSVLGYPLGTDIWAAWVVTHAVVPLSVPAAVGFGYLLRGGLATLSADDPRPNDAVAAPDGNGRQAPASDPADRGGASGGDPVRLAAVAVLLVAVVGTLVATNVGAVYLDPASRDSDADMVQFAQPAGDVRPGLAAVEAAIEGNEGTDVLYSGQRYYLLDERALDRPPVPDGTGPWFRRLPLPWYFEQYGAETASVRNVTELRPELDPAPPVVVADARYAEDVRALLGDGYRTYEYDLRNHVDGPGQATRVVVFVIHG
jgi:uncharacterized protein (TIGR03663 family)